MRIFSTVFRINVYVVFILSSFGLFSFFSRTADYRTYLFRKSREAVLAEEAEVTNSAWIGGYVGPTSTPVPQPTATPVPSVGPLTPTPTPILITGILTPAPTQLITPQPSIQPTPTPPQIVVKRYSLFGYTSAKADVRLEGIGLLEERTADHKGYFEFINFFAPAISKEFCLVSIDTEGLVAPPLCIEAPQNPEDQRYGPFLLPPTLRLSNGNIQKGEITVISGKTIPGTSVTVNTFNHETPQFLSLQPVGTVLAATSLKYQKQALAAAADGTFTTSLTGDSTGKIRVFAQSRFLEQATPKSITLTLNILTYWLAVIRIVLKFLFSLFNLNTILFLQLLVIVLLVLKKMGKLNWFGMQKEKVALRLNYTPIDYLIS